MTTVNRLKAIPIFQHLQDDELQKILKISEVRTIKKGETLFRAGDRRDAFFIQLSGQIHIFRVTNNEVQTLALLDPNEFAVETALVDPHHRHEHFGEMIEEGEVLIIQAKHFHDFREKYPDIANKIFCEIIENLAGRLHHANNKIVTIFATGRIASMYDDLEHLTDLLLDTILQITKARRAIFVLFRPLEGKAVIVDAKGYQNDQEMKNLSISLNEDPIFGPLYHSGRDILISEEQFKQERALHTPYASRNMLATPLMLEKKIIGAIVLGDKEGDHEFSHNNQILVNIIARQVALPIAAAAAEFKK